jgi:peptide/nickel transport system ATP-binding protein
VRDVLTAPRHPYTHGLMASTPLASQGKARLHQIEGAMPRLNKVPEGCPFHPRCDFAQAQCRAAPSPQILDGAAACWFPMSVEKVAS